MDHVSQEVGLPGFTKTADPNVRQELLLQDVLGILDPLVSCHSRFGSSHSNEVHGNGLFLDDESLVQGGLKLRAKTQAIQVGEQA